MANGGGNYTRRISEEEARKLAEMFNVTVSGSSDGEWFIGQVNPDRSKITHPNGTEFSLIYTGQVKDYTLAYRVNATTAYAIGSRKNLTPFIEGGGLHPVDLRLDFGDTNETTIIDFKTGHFCYVPIPSQWLTWSQELVPPQTSNWEGGFTPSGKHLAVWYVKVNEDEETRLVSSVILHWIIYKNWGMDQAETKLEPSTFTYDSVETGTFDMTAGIQSNLPDDPEIPEWEDTWTWNQYDPSSALTDVTWTFTLEEADDVAFHNEVGLTYGVERGRFPDFSSYNLGFPSEVPWAGVNIFPFETPVEGSSDTTPDLYVAFNICAEKKRAYFKRLASIEADINHFCAILAAFESYSATFTYDLVPDPEYFLDTNCISSAITMTNTVPHNSGGSGTTQTYSWNSGPSQYGATVLEGNYTTPAPSHPTNWDLNIYGCGTTHYYDCEDPIECNDVHQHVNDLKAVLLGSDQNNNEWCTYLRSTWYPQVHSGGGSYLTLGTTVTGVFGADLCATSSSSWTWSTSQRFKQESVTFKQFFVHGTVKTGTIEAREGTVYSQEGYCDDTEAVVSGSTQTLTSSNGLQNIFVPSKNSSSQSVALMEHSHYTPTSGGNISEIDDGYFFHEPISDSIGTITTMNPFDWNITFSDVFQVQSNPVLDEWWAFQVTDSLELVAWDFTDDPEKIEFAKIKWNPTEGRMVQGQKTKLRIPPILEGVFFPIWGTSWRFI